MSVRFVSMAVRSVTSVTMGVAMRSVTCGIEGLYPEGVIQHSYGSHSPFMIKIIIHLFKMVLFQFATLNKQRVYQRLTTLAALASSDTTDGPSIVNHRSEFFPHGHAWHSHVAVHRRTFAHGLYKSKWGHWAFLSPPKPCGASSCHWNHPFLPWQSLRWWPCAKQ